MKSLRIRLPLNLLLPLRPLHRHYSMSKSKVFNAIIIAWSWYNANNDAKMQDKPSASDELKTSTPCAPFIPDLFTRSAVFSYKVSKGATTTTSCPYYCCLQLYLVCTWTKIVIWCWLMMMDFISIFPNWKAVEENKEEEEEAFFSITRMKWPTK